MSTKIFFETLQVPGINNSDPEIDIAGRIEQDTPIYHPKHRIWPKYIDQEIDQMYRKYMYKIAKRGDGVEIIVICMCLLNSYKSIVGASASGEIHTTQTGIIARTLIALALLSGLAYFVLSGFIWKGVKKLQDTRFHVLLAMIVTGCVGNSMLLLARVLFGTCPIENGQFDYYWCNPIPGTLPLYHLYILSGGIWMCYFFTKGSALLLTFFIAIFNYCILMYCITAVASLEISLPIVGVYCIQLFIIRGMAYKDMKMFEYYLALKKGTDENAELAELEKKQVKMVLANVAHDLKTPLIAFESGINFIVNTIQNLQQQISSGINNNNSDNSINELLFATQEVATDMEANCTFMTMQINRTLDVSKIENKVDLVSTYESVAIVQTVNWAIKMMKTVQTRVNISLKCSLHPETHAITDKGWFQENLVCLLSNAVKYSASDSSNVILRLSIVSPSSFEILNAISPRSPQSTSRNDDNGNFSDRKTPPEKSAEYLLVEVEDFGIGVPPEFVNKLFQPFVKTQRRAGGTGLGLFSLALRMSKLGGYYGLKVPSDHSGSIFYFAVPFSEDMSRSQISSADVSPIREPFRAIIKSIPYTEESKESINRVHSNDTSVSSAIDIASLERKNIRKFFDESKASILVVDDSAPTLKFICRSLAHEGIAVAMATDGSVALKLMKANVFTVVMMDIQMPIMDGIEAIRQLREWENGSKGDQYRQYVIGMTANPDDDVKFEASMAGMDEYIRKPVPVSHILNVLRERFLPV